MFKKLFLTALIGGYIAWPYQTVRRFWRAVYERDRDTLGRLIDTDSIKASVKSSLADALAGFAKSKEGAARGISAAEIRKRMGSAEVEREFDQHFTEENLITALTANVKDPSKYEREPKTRWTAPWEVSVVGCDGYARMRFRLKGLQGWKLAAIEFTTGDARKMLTTQR